MLIKRIVLGSIFDTSFTLQYEEQWMGKQFSIITQTRKQTVRLESCKYLGHFENYTFSLTIFVFDFPDMEL